MYSVLGLYMLYARETNAARICYMEMFNISK